MGPVNGSLKRNINRALIAVAGLATVAAHWLVLHSHEQELRRTIEAVVDGRITALTAASYEQRLVREREFVRKEEVASIGLRIEKLADRLDDLAQRDSDLEGYLRGRDRASRRESAAFWRRTLQKNR